MNAHGSGQMNHEGKVLRIDWEVQRSEHRDPLMRQLKRSCSRAGRCL